MKAEWSDEFETGVYWIDNQHKNIIKRINKLSKAIENGRGEKEIDQLITFLEVYARTHFSVEEKYMEEYKYPGFTFHKKEHKEFANTLKGIRKEYAKMPVKSEMVKHLHYELWQYFVNHISVIDAALGRFLKSKGAK